MSLDGPKEVETNKPEKTYKGSISYIGDENKIDFYDYSVNRHTLHMGNSKMDSLAVLNESPFYICETCGYGALEKQYEGTFVSKKHKNSNGKKCNNERLKSYSMPDFISNADCKLTLYRNCRNTKNIAETSIRLLNSETRVIVREGTINGNSPVLGVCDNKEKTLAYLNYQLDHYWENGLTNVQILTCKTMTSTLLASELYGEFYRYKGVQIPMTTCRKFKGLEADAIILVDMDFDLFSSRENKVFYVGASRARHELTMLANLTEEECIEILEMHEKKAGKNIEKKVAALFNAKLLRI